MLESSRKDGEPLSFEIGAGEITGNPLYQVRWSAGLQASMCVYTRRETCETRGNKLMKHGNMPGGGQHHMTCLSQCLHSFYCWGQYALLSTQQSL